MPQQRDDNIIKQKAIPTLKLKRQEKYLDNLNETYKDNNLIKTDLVPEHSNRKPFIGPENISLNIDTLPNQQFSKTEFRETKSFELSPKKDPYPNIREQLFPPPIAEVIDYRKNMNDDSQLV